MTRPVATVPLLLALALGSASGTAQGGSSGLMETNGTIRVGQPAPPISNIDLKGQSFSLKSLVGRPVFVDFGSVLCDACAHVVEEMNRMATKYTSSDLKIIMIADGAMPVKATEDFFSRLNASFTVIRDANWEHFEAYGVTVVPFKVLIDREGLIRKMHIGYDSKLDKLMDFKEVLGQ